MKPKIALELGQEYPPSDEATAIEQVKQIVADLQQRDNPPDTAPSRRGQHPKAHGCVKAEFTVSDAVPEPLRHGIFKEPKTYPAWIRFSPSASPRQPDTNSDVHGMAMKLMKVEGEKILAAEKDAQTQDFLTINDPAFFIRNATDYVLFSAAFATGNPLPFFFGWNPFRWRLHEFIRLLTMARHSFSNPLQSQYWSTTPYKLGPHAIKFSTQPCSSTVDPMPESPSPDFLHAAMAKQLATEDVYFDFLVQLQTHPVKMPVEDATFPWSETQSPFQKVASICIPKQPVDPPEIKAFCENLSFNPWHSLPDHRPLGCINRIRRAVYETLAQMRHQMNQVPNQEPTGDEVF